jgi:hypothetical protein
LEGMKNVAVKTCKCGSGLQKYYNIPNSKKAEFCSQCRTKNMINVHLGLCQCNSVRPIFGYKKDMKPICCKKCKKINMIDVVSKMCECGKFRARFGYKNDNPIYCSICKKSNMIDLLEQKCLCGVQATYGYKNDKKRIACISCKTSDMICIKNGCKCGKSRASYGYKNDKKPSRCINCKENDMISFSKKCSCGKQMSFGFEKDKIPIACNNCKTPGMINIVDLRKRCKGPLCETIGNKKYRGYCTHCFAHLFPKDPLTFQIRQNSKELKVRAFLEMTFEGFIHDKPLWLNGCDCTHKRRIDSRKLIGNTLLCVEVDEEQHKGYDQKDEENRYHDLEMIHGGKFIFIRYNPDKYTDKNGKKRNPQLKTRLKRLKEEIEMQMKRIENNENTELLEVIKLYYN